MKAKICKCVGRHLVVNTKASFLPLLFPSETGKQVHRCVGDQLVKCVNIVKFSVSLCRMTAMKKIDTPPDYEGDRWHVCM